MPKKPTQHRYRFHDNVHHIDFRLTKVDQLFDTRDPSPFRERDLDDAFVRSLLSSARELQHHGPFRLCLILGSPSGISSKEVTDAIHHYFLFEAQYEEQELHDQRARGFFILTLGLIFLGICSAGAFFVARTFPGVASEILAEGLTILGWVALWEPLSILLYDWWPSSRKIALYRILSRVPVDVISEA